MSDRYDPSPETAEEPEFADEVESVAKELERWDTQLRGRAKATEVYELRNNLIPLLRQMLELVGVLGDELADLAENAEEQALLVRHVALTSATTQTVMLANRLAVRVLQAQLGTPEDQAVAQVLLETSGPIVQGLEALAAAAAAASAPETPATDAPPAVPVAPSRAAAAEAAAQSIPSAS